MKLRRRNRPPVATKSENMTLFEHLGELRMRLIRSLLAVVVGGVVVFVLYDPWIQNFLFHPYHVVCSTNPKYQCNGDPLLTTPLGGFTTRMKVAGWGGLILALPIVLWQIWRFIVPGLETKEKKYARPFIISTLALFALGATIAYLTLSKALDWLISFSGNAKVGFTPESYVSLVGLMMAAFGAGFLFPVLLVFLEIGGVLTYKQLLGWWRYATVIIAFVAAVITPSGDPISMLALGVPMWFLYWASIGIGWIVARRRAKATTPAPSTA